MLFRELTTFTVASNEFLGGGKEATHDAADVVDPTIQRFISGPRDA